MQGGSCGPDIHAGETKQDLSSAGGIEHPINADVRELVKIVWSIIFDVDFERRTF